MYVSSAQIEDKESLFQRFQDSYNAGDLVSAEKNLLLILNSKYSLSEEYKAYIYNSLGVTNSLLGKYKNALEYYSKAEAIMNGTQSSSFLLGSVYINKAIIYGYQKSYPLALEYFEKGLRIYKALPADGNAFFSGLASAYLNYGIILLEVKDYRSALINFEKSAEIKLKYSLSGLALVYLNIAKTFAKTGDSKNAEKFYIKSIDRFTDEFNDSYFRLAEVYFDYALFLDSEGRDIEALEANRKALSICLKNYGEKNTLVSLSYKHLGDHYINQADYKSALEYYQSSLIAVVSDFNDQDIYSNPLVDSSLFDIRLLDNLKSKASALDLFANEQADQAMKLTTINKSLETIELALQLIDRIRNNYPDEESRIYLSENEKETYLFAVHIASKLYKLTGENAVKEKIYTIAQKAKSAVLRNEITENNFLYSVAIHDTTRVKQNTLTSNIAAYNNLINQEAQKTNPDSTRISRWKDAVFNMNRENEKITVQINREFPQYNNLIQKIEPVPLDGIQKHLRRDETIIDYLLSNQYRDGVRELYTLVITKDGFEFMESGLDSLFLKNAGIIRNSFQHPEENNFSEFTSALGYMYGELLKPVRELIAGKKLIIIPDEEIAWLPFDAFLENEPGPDQAGYEGLQYLLYDYSISYCYFSSLIFNSSIPKQEGEEVLSFAPNYGLPGDNGPVPESLLGAVNELESAYRWFRGKSFTGESATETNFRLAMQQPAIFHLAMHSVSDSANSRYSYLLFYTLNDTLEDGRLYNYEISLSRLKSPMVVLSACNSGTGTLYHGEGLMSLARGFILAGASAVIMTSWEVNDEISADIISNFYNSLSRGKRKDDALRHAKLKYLEGASPAYWHPYYWAAYEVMGSCAPVRGRFRASGLIICTLLLIAGVVSILYLRRRRIFSDRLL